MSKKLKVLFFTSTYSNGGGSERVLTVLANNLPKTWDVDILEVVAFNAKKENVKNEINILPHLLWHGYRTRFSQILLRVMKHHPQIIKTLRGLYGYDVVVGWMAIEGVSILPAFPESKTIAWFHNSINHLNKVYSIEDVKYYSRKRVFNILKKACNSADKIVGVSKMSKASIIGVYPECENKSCIIYNGTDIEELQKMSKEKIEDAALVSLYSNLVKTAPVLMCIGHICQRKNFSLAVHSLALLQKRGIACNLVIIGTPLLNSVQEMEELQHVINECNVQHHVFLFGAQKNPLPFLLHAKLLLITSLDEGFPTVATEAMSLGVPFITTPVEGASDELSNGGTCGLVAGWNAEEYANCIEKLLKNEKLYSAMSQNCKEHVKNYSIENYVDSLKNLINEIPKKDRCKKRRMNIVVATLLFIFYSAFYSVYEVQRTYYVAKARFHTLKTHFNFINFTQFCYRLGIFAVNVLCFPTLIAYCGILVLKYRKKLFG